MLLSNWTILQIEENSNSTLAWSSFFIKTLTMGLTNIVYLFSLILPRFYPNRI